MKPDLKIVVSNPPPEPELVAAPEQAEMPFAVVNGEPMTQLPRDLYIPPQALEIFLEAFEGPLDLLLDLIRKQEINIYDIPIAQITAQYIEYMQRAAEMNIELSAEFILMAATLIHIKSRMLLPRDPELEKLLPEEDPRLELVEKLLERERFKTAAEMLQQKRVVEEAVWSNAQI